MNTVRNALILLLSVIMIFFVSCASEDTGSESGSDKESCMSVAGEDVLTGKQKKFSEDAKNAIAEYYGISDLSKLTFVKVQEQTSTYNNKKYRYTYKLSELFGYRTNATINVCLYLDEIGRLASDTVDGYGDEVLYFLDILTKEKLDEAAASIKQQMGENADAFSPYFMLDDEGYLCMQVEIIEHYETPTENGTDHKHVFYSEKIIQKP